MRRNPDHRLQHRQAATHPVEHGYSAMRFQPPGAAREDCADQHDDLRLVFLDKICRGRDQRLVELVFAKCVRRKWVIDLSNAADPARDAVRLDDLQIERESPASPNHEANARAEHEGGNQRGFGDRHDGPVDQFARCPQP